MPPQASSSLLDPPWTERARQLARDQEDLQYRRIDRLFALLLPFEFAAGVVIALWISPFSWAGDTSQLHPHVWSALLLGGFIISLPLLLTKTHPGKSITRHVIAIAQLLLSGLLIHLTQGRIETHFHVFGSLAFLAFYRDWRILVTASLITALDHLVRGYAWPLSIYGVEIYHPWRWLEHTGWVVFEDIFLVFACLQSKRETYTLAERQSQLESTNEHIEQQVQQRTDELLRNRASLQDNEQRTRAILEGAADAVITVDEHGIIESVNPATQRLFGHPPDELLGKSINLLLPGLLRDEPGGSLQEQFSAKHGHVIRIGHELRGSRRDGSTFHADLTLSEAQLKERRIFTGFVRDISDRKRAEAELHAAKEAAETANRAKSSFLANMSHEIRTPMNGIIGMAQLLSRTDLRPPQRDYLATVDESAQILLRLLNDILDFSKIEAGKLELDCIDFSISECIARASHVVALRAAEKSLEVACRISPDIPDLLRGDPGRLQQVLVNLLSNAVKFTPAGEILVNVNTESHTSDLIRIHISVSDTGIGIPKDKLDLIFQPFEQVESSTARRFGGTGLGLAISRQIVGMMQGRMWVESEPGRGSTFHFLVELGVSPDQNRPEPAVLESLRDLSVLVVDDNFTNRRILSEILQHWHMQPVLANSAAAARQALQTARASQSPIRLILLDYHMPGEDGLHFVESVKDDLKRDQCPIIMISSGSTPLDAELSQKEGIDFYMTKPVIASELLDVVLRQFGGDTAPRPPPPKSSNTIVHVHPRRVLLVEDNRINRLVAIELLRSRGHQVSIAENGQEAVQAFGEQNFDVILMDMQMPVMDGYEATATIRRRERRTGGHVPIVAMTAEALKGDRERCLATGMDDYVSKPITPDELYRAVECFPAIYLTVAPPTPPPRFSLPLTPPPRSRPPVPKPPPTPPAPPAPQKKAPAIDWDVAKKFLGDGADVIAEFSSLLKSEIPPMLAEIRRSIQERNSRALKHAAHTLKGSVLYFGAESLSQTALALELLGRTGSFEGSAELLASLETDLHALLAALDTTAP